MQPPEQEGEGEDTDVSHQELLVVITDSADVGVLFNLPDLEDHKTCISLLHCGIFVPAEVD